MRKYIIYLLKHNALLQFLYVVTAGAFFRGLGMLIKTDKDLVLFVSMMGKSFGDSPRVIFDYMRSRPEYRKYKCVWAFEEPKKFPGVRSVKIDTWRYFYLSLKAKYWITNTNIERGLHYKKKGQIYLNTWHGTPLKKIGNDCPGRHDFDYRNVDYLTVSGEYEERVFKTAFKVDGKNYLRCGMPRNDRLWSANRLEYLKAREKLNIPHGKKVILYAPTWRESRNGGKSYEIRPPVHFDMWKAELGEDYVVLFRAHYLTTKILGVQYDAFVRDASSYPEVNDLMIASDMLITDYSSIAFDYSILSRPILIYAYDYEAYLSERGAYFEMDSAYPNRLCHTEEELLTKIKTFDYTEERAKTQKFREQFVQYGGNATERCVKALLG